MKKIFVIITFLLIPFTGFSATQGNLGLTSTGSVVINLTLGKVAKISGLSDISITYTPGVSSGNGVGYSSACIYTNTSSTSYTIKATSINFSGGNMNVSDGATPTPNRINYTASWFSTATPSGSGTLLGNATASTSLSGANNSSTSCGGSPNASIQVTFLQADLEAAKAGNYTDTLTLLVSPV